jgi:hypothetical protein
MSVIHWVLLLILAVPHGSFAVEKDCANCDGAHKTAVEQPIKGIYDPVVESLAGAIPFQDHASISERVLPILKTVSGTPKKSKLNGYCRITYEMTEDYPLSEIPSSGVRDFYIVKRSFIDHQADIGRQILKEPYWIHFQFSDRAPGLKAFKKGSGFTYNYCESKLEVSDLGLEMISAHNNLLSDKNPISPETINSLIQRVGFTAVKYRN